MSKYLLAVVLLASFSPNLNADIVYSVVPHEIGGLNLGGTFVLNDEGTGFLDWDVSFGNFVADKDQANSEERGFANLLISSTEIAISKGSSFSVRSRNAPPGGGGNRDVRFIWGTSNLHENNGFGVSFGQGIGSIGQTSQNLNFEGDRIVIASRAVPEPGAWTLMLVGLACCGLWRKRKIQHAN